MSLEILKEQIEKFLISDMPEVLAIKGKWGVGKTFTWNKFLNEAKDNNNIKLNKYAYVSLFGINSLADFKSAIFEQIIDKAIIGIEANIDTFNSNATNLLKSFGRKTSIVSRLIPGVKSFSPIIDSIFFLSINRIIICIDDFERKGEKLTPMEILGLISQLKEQKKCKIVLIFNDENLPDDDKKQYNLLREKVIDKELIFDPSSEETINIAFTGKTPVYQKIKSFTTQLKINNIRILQKIEQLSLELETSLQRYEEGVLHQALHSLTLFCVAFYSPNSNDTPNLDYIKKFPLKNLSLNKKTKILKNKNGTYY